MEVRVIFRFYEKSAMMLGDRRLDGPEGGSG
jgi:hypothetical protein